MKKHVTIITLFLTIFLLGGCGRSYYMTRHIMNEVMADTFAEIRSSADSEIRSTTAELISDLSAADISEEKSRYIHCMNAHTGHTEFLISEPDELITYLQQLDIGSWETSFIIPDYAEPSHFLTISQESVSLYSQYSDNDYEDLLFITLYEDLGQIEVCIEGTPFESYYRVDDISVFLNDKAL